MKQRSAVPLPILALACATFAIGTTEFVVMGILPEPGAPPLALLTSRMPRQLALLPVMGIFIIGNAFCALAPDYITLMIARVVTSFAHGSVFGIGSVVAASLAVSDKRAGAIALMFTGQALANVLGVPFGTFIAATLNIGAFNIFASGG